MTVLFAGAELEAFNVSGAGPQDGDTTSGSYDTACARCAIVLASSGTFTDYVETPTFASQTTVWIHFESYSALNGYRSTATLCQVHNSSGTAVFRIQATADNTLQAQYWNGSAWTNIGSTYTTAAATRYEFDLKLVCGGSGSFELYSSRSLALSGSASMTSVTNAQKVRWYNCYNGISTTRTRLSQAIVADESTVGWKYYSRPPTADGANTAWTGTYADVDEATLSTADYAEGVNANDVETYTGAALSLTGTVKAVVVSASVKQVATGPQNVQAAIRRGSTNYFSSNLSIGAGFAPAQAIFSTDPSTGVAWTAANAASASTEFGLKAIT